MIFFSFFFYTKQNDRHVACKKSKAGVYQLGDIVGRGGMHKIPRRYFDTWRFKQSIEKDFMGIAQKISSINLQWYFDLWTNRAYTEATRSKAYHSITLKRKARPMSIMHHGWHMGELLHPIEDETRRKRNETPEIKRETLPDGEWMQERGSFNLAHTGKNIKNIILKARFCLAYAHT